MPTIHLTCPTGFSYAAGTDDPGTWNRVYATDDSGRNVSELVAGALIAYWPLPPEEMTAPVSYDPAAQCMLIQGCESYGLEDLAGNVEEALEDMMPLVNVTTEDGEGGRLTTSQ